MGGVPWNEGRAWGSSCQHCCMMSAQKRGQSGGTGSVLPRTVTLYATVMKWIPLYGTYIKNEGGLENGGEAGKWNGWWEDWVGRG